MQVHIVACGIFQKELEQVLRELKEEWTPNCDFIVTYTAPALHVDYVKLKTGITAALHSVNEEHKVLFFGSMCHPDLQEIAAVHQAGRQLARNCIELFLGKDRLPEKEPSQNIFYLTPGWLENWQSIFRQGQGWDDIDARQNFGFYDKIVLLDTGVSELADDAILEFFEYTQVPIAIEEVGLEVFKEMVAETLREAAGRTG